MKRFRLTAWATLAVALLALGSSGCGFRDRPFFGRFASRFRPANGQVCCPPCCDPCCASSPVVTGASFPVSTGVPIGGHNIGTPLASAPTGACCGGEGGPILGSPAIIPGLGGTNFPVTPGTTVPPSATIPGAIQPGTIVPPSGQPQPLPRLIPEAQPTPASPASRTKKRK